jgi:beta-lactam-binding protein with PASTA domain
VLALAVLVLFAGAAYMVSSLVRANNAANAQVIIPEVEGDTLKVATDKLTAAKFEFTIAHQASNTPKNSAIKTDPLGGTAHKQGSMVTLYISSGPASGTVPDVKGKSQADAVALLTAQGFVQGLVSSEDAPGVAKGLVSRTDPAAGQTADSGSKIALYLSNGKIHVPDVTGKTQAEATAALNKAGIDNTLITVVLVQSDQTPGTVLEQDPKDVTIDGPRPVKLFVVQPAQQTQSSTTDTGGNNGGGNNGNGNGGGNNDGGQQSNPGQSGSPSP